MSYPYLCNNANIIAGKPAAGSFNTLKTVFIDHLINGSEAISLLEAPPISKKSQWKLRSFLHFEKKTCPEIDFILYSRPHLSIEHTF